MRRLLGTLLVLGMLGGLTGCATTLLVDDLEHGDSTARKAVEVPLVPVAFATDVVLFPLEAPLLVLSGFIPPPG